MKINHGQAQAALSQLITHIRKKLFFPFLEVTPTKSSTCPTSFPQKTEVLILHVLQTHLIYNIHFATNCVRYTDGMHVQICGGFATVLFYISYNPIWKNAKFCKLSK